jgi:hypothetical protein
MRYRKLLYSLSSGFKSSTATALAPGFKLGSNWVYHVNDGMLGLLGLTELTRASTVSDMWMMVTEVR